MRKKVLRSERFLAEMDKVIPWKNLLEELEQFYVNHKVGRPKQNLELMLRIQFLQLWYNLSDPAAEEAIYDRLSFQNFLGFDCFGGEVPDETTICRFRHFLEENGLSERILSCMNTYLSANGLVLREGTVVDATLIDAPVSKKNKQKQRDPEMSSTKKNNKWHFGAKGHIGVQSNGKPLIHSVAFSTAKEHDIKQLENLQHGEEKAIFGDSAYSRKEDKRRARADGKHYGINDKGARQKPLSPGQKKKNQRHSKIRCKVEHPFRQIKHVWGQNKCKYKGLAKNEHWFRMLCALSNVYFSRHDLLAMRNVAFAG